MKCDSATSHEHRTTGGLYGAIAFALVVISCFAGYFYTERFYQPASMVPLTFFLGAVYSALGILGNTNPDQRRGRRLALYFVTQCALLTALLWLSPIRGFFAILVLPIVSEAIFELRPRSAVLVGAYLYAQTILLWAVPYGWPAVGEAMLNYSAAFGFTIGFSLISRHALATKEREVTLRKELETANQKLRAFAEQAGELATTQERNRLAREIHDGVGHYLTVVKTQLDAAAALIPIHPERARDTVTSAAKLTAEALDDVRRSVGSLRSEAGRPPLTTALADLARYGEPAPAVSVAGTPRPLPSAIEHALFRAAQEGLTNTRKHAGAQTCSVLLDFRAPGRVALEVADDGRGRSTASDERTGFGLTGLRERIELLGGRVESGNRPEGGFRLRVEVPS